MLIIALLGHLTSQEPSDRMRNSPVSYVTSRKLIDLQMCVTRDWSQAGTVTPIPLENGVTLDFYTKGILAGPGKSRLSFTIRERADQRLIGVDYRHPMSGKNAAKALAWVVKKCAPEAQRSSLDGN